MSRLISPMDLDIYQRFATRLANGCNPDISLATDACRYWKGKNSIFITHFKWMLGDQPQEMCRAVIADTWVKALNLTWRLFFSQRAIRSALRKRPNLFQDPADEANYQRQGAYLTKIQRLQYYLSRFLTKLIPIDLDSHAPQEWKDTDVPNDSIHLVQHYIDISASPLTYPFQVVLILRDLVSDTGQGEILEDFTSRFVENRPDLLPLPFGRRMHSIDIDNMDKAISDDGKVYLEPEERDIQEDRRNQESVGWWNLWARIGSWSPWSTHKDPNLADTTEHGNADQDEAQPLVTPTDSRHKRPDGARQRRKLEREFRGLSGDDQAKEE